VRTPHGGADRGACPWTLLVDLSPGPEGGEAAARQFHAREGHLRPARKHVEMINVDGGSEGKQEAVKLGAWLDNTRRRAAKLSPERRAQLASLGLEWAAVA